MLCAMEKINYPIPFYWLANEDSHNRLQYAIILPTTKGSISPTLTTMSPTEHLVTWWMVISCVLARHRGLCRVPFKASALRSLWRQFESEGVSLKLSGKVFSAKMN